MIESIHFQNLKALRDCTLPLSPVTVLLGPNGSGKSTVLDVLKLVNMAVGNPGENPQKEILVEPISSKHGDKSPLEIKLFSTSGNLAFWKPRNRWVCIAEKENPDDRSISYNKYGSSQVSEAAGLILEKITPSRVFEFDANSISASGSLRNEAWLPNDGANLSVTLDQLRDKNPEGFIALNHDLTQWLPEFDQVLFDTEPSGNRAFLLRTVAGGHDLPATALSSGTLMCLALLCVVHQLDPPKIIGLEEPDRELHPRLLRLLHDAIYRLAYPAEHGEDREPVQVILTTHNPYLVDQFKDHPEHVVIAKKEGLDVTFERLSDQPGLQESLYELSLGEAWYSGILGGVPAPQ